MKRALKWAGGAVAGLVILVLLALGGVYGFSTSHVNRSYAVHPAPLTTTVDPASAELVAKGERLLKIRGCTDCHRPDLGGGMMIDDPVVGRLWATNLTRGEGGVAASYEDRDWVRAIRHGIGPDGKALLFMPSHEFYPIGDEDLAAMISYIRSVPPVDRTIPAIRLGPLARVLYLAGQMPLIPARLIDHEAPRPTTPAPGPTIEYGEYLATGCIGCHGPTYSGGRIPGTPPDFGIPSNITPDAETGIGGWTEADFVRLMRTGIRPDGTEVDDLMPVAMTREMTDMELSAIWAYLRTLEPKPFGSR